ncbi:MAG: hypothetical protein A2508_08865 [Candidatus Lambdaproteobacteria bacterium RIFOXYD12_FULL_49_8]|uniref:Nitrogen fixation protein NifQ n=1 Tax=Candidatus Lambdaproteobacteria bacterium RIFOXYD2_FULL_50_16 TaxID=1817772 RepID=A0A1F6G8R5_9PROT|nr:MAG: hypothetical protein A2527_01415 [Candidatus Lambdaproteobacteria bacterium RIFOXYD2_FULL_50_16]OGG97341.1 MAG: hypothetical protein A2508_08865 [Candidatus Lambdaproteobacteria bacterium RIFOXYD12_FULL_49_8]
MEPSKAKRFRAQLEAHQTGLEYGEFMAQILASHLAGEGAMPYYLGLKESEFEKMIKAYFGDLRVVAPTCAPLDESRCPEREDLERYLASEAENLNPSTLWFIQIIIAGLLGANHLWEDLGLVSRPELRRLLEAVFPKMAVKNTQNMRWKKFIYKQLCIAEGFVYVCRSPSCEQCSEYSLCFETKEEQT